MNLRFPPADDVMVETDARHVARPIGMILVQLGSIDEADIDRILERQQETGALFGDTAVELRLVEAGMVKQALDQQNRETSSGGLLTPTQVMPAEPDVVLGDPVLADKLRDVLSALTQGQDIHRTPQRIVISGVHVAHKARMMAASLGTACANSGYRVLLIDADLDQPSLHRTFGISNDLGLSKLLSGSDAPHHLVQRTSIANLAVICAGPPVRNYSSLIAREQVFHRLEPLARAFDYMLIDTGALAPALVARLSAGADNVVIAVEENVTSMRDLANMVELLQAEGVPHPVVLMIE